MIEAIVYQHMKTALNERGIQCYMTRPEDVTDQYVLIEKTGGSETNHVKRSTFAFQSYAPELLQASVINELVKEVAATLVEETEVYGTRYITDYNFTNPADKIPRYQAVFDIYYYDNY